MQEANALVGGWMREAGLETREDAVGNLIGRRGDGPVLMLGSHLDTVVDAGRYDGPLGVLVAIEAAERVARDLEVVGFADEEGVRFGTAYLGSSAMTGRFDPAWLELRDDGDVRLGDLVGDPGAGARGRARLRRGPHRAGPGARAARRAGRRRHRDPRPEPRRGDVRRRGRPRRHRADGRPPRRARRRRRVDPRRRAGGRHGRPRARSSRTCAT